MNVVNPTQSHLHARDMKMNNLDKGIKCVSIQDEWIGQDLAFDIETINDCRSEKFELHIRNLKRRMIDLRQDRVAWEAVATELCRTLDFMLLSIKNPMACEGTYQYKRYGINSASLTHKQLKIIHLASKGLNNKVIAKEMGISSAAVAQMLTRAYRTIGVSTRYEAIAKCRDYSWI